MHQSRRAFFACVLAFYSAALLSTGGCQRAPSPVAPEALISTENSHHDSKNGLTHAADFDRIGWVQRVARVLRGGKSLRDPQLIKDLAAKSDGDVIDYLLEQPEFADTALDFNLHFLGFRRDHIRDLDGELSETVYDFPSAISSAREVLKNGDYLKLLEFQQPLYHGRLKPPVMLEGVDKSIGLEAMRARHFALIQDGIGAQIAFLEAHPETTIGEACNRFIGESRDGYQLTDVGIYLSVMDVGYNTNIWYGRIVEVCQGPVVPEGFNFLVELKRLKATNQKFFSSLSAFEPAQYSTVDLDQVRALDVVTTGYSPTGWHMFARPHRQALMNSSTNFNRKRAAYVLSRFFCDDLTPINVENPLQHTGGAHGSEPSCFACHYKLDPMAGFFRDYGYLFSEFKSSLKIRFDDNGSADRAEYAKAWLAPEGSKRKWNVGFIRSSTKENLNSYGENIEDLFRIIQREPEVKRCLVKRMFEYFVSDQQALDGGYHHHLTETFISRAKTNSTLAFKEVVKQLLLSRSFNVPDPVADECYDFPPGYDPSGRPPCRVAYILEKNCASCHGSTLDEPFLDLTSWKKLPSGASSFPHYSDSGEPIEMTTTFERLLERLTTADPKKRMPLRKYMDNIEREVLFKWATETLNRKSFTQVPFAFVIGKKPENICPVVH